MRRGEWRTSVGYVLWIFGFLGAHRFYFGRPVSGTIYLFTFGLFSIGIIYDWWALNEQISSVNHERGYR